MTQEDKELLLKDLCARLQYKPKALINGHLATILGIDENIVIMCIDDNDYKDETIISADDNSDDVKLYLRSMSSMTKEEKVHLSQYACIGEDLNGEFIDEVQRKDCAAYIDWLNKHNFDYRGLIEKGLAIEAPEDMYKI